jgi:hypothetical protein
LDFHKSDVLKAANCVQVGIIQTFYPSTQTADIQIALKKIISINQDGTRTLAAYPLLQQVPVFILTGGTAYITMPISAGDTCIILFNDREIDNWYNTGTQQAPTTLRLHDKSDALAIIGIRNTQNLISSYFSGTRIQHDATTHLDITDGNFKLYGNLEVTGNITIDGTGGGTSGSSLTLTTNLRQSSSSLSIHAGNGANGTFGTVTVVDGIVISGS